MRGESGDDESSCHAAGSRLLPPLIHFTFGGSQRELAVLVLELFKVICTDF